MCSSTPAPPPAPDPVATANAQGIMNQSTATTQQLLNMTNQVGPNGTLTYNQTGTNSFVDGNGKTINVPQFTATTTLSPDQQALYDLTNQTQQNLGQIGVEQSQKIGDLLGTNVDLDTATENKIDQLGRARLDPQFAQSEDALRTRLANQGIQPGSAAWNAEMQSFQQGRNDAYNQLYLTGRSQGAQEALAERNQPINEITALMSGSQVSQPNFVNTPQTQVGGVDYAGMVNNNYNAQMQGYNAQLQNQGAMMGGLFGLGGTLGTAAMKYGPGLMAMSDRRAKEDIERVGTLDNGLPVYLYRYKSGGPMQIGVMAQDVEEIHPEAVAMGSDGFKRVNYAQAVRA